MRNVTIGLLCLLLCAAASAQEKPNAVYFFVTNPSYAESDASGSQFGGAIGLAFQRRLGERWSGEIAIARERRTVDVVFIDLNEPPVVRSRSWTSTPIDAVVQYHFLRSDASWRPYVGAGARWAEAPPDAREEDGELLGAINAGVVWQFRPAFGVRFDGKLLVGDRPAYLDSVQGSVGVAFRF